MEVCQRLLHEGQKLLNEERFAEAKVLLERAATDALNLLGVLYGQKIGNPDLAIKCLKMASEIDKSNYTIQSNLAHILNSLDKFDEAVDHAVKGVKLSKEEIYGPIYNAAVIFNNSGSSSQAIDYYYKALELEDSPPIRYNLGTCLLLNGQYKEGWEQYEYRLTAFKRTIDFENRFNHPRWQGEDLNGKKIVVYNEQGIGDLINFCRYLPNLSQLGADIILESQQEIADLIQDNYPFVKVVKRGHDNYPLPPCGDYAVSICSLPGRLGCDDWKKISGKPYLRSNPLPREKKLKVGIAWAGNQDHGHDYMRSCPVKWFEKLVTVPNIQLFSLQKDLHYPRFWKDKWVNPHEGREKIPMVDLSPFMNTFSDTASFLDELDLIITIDSAIAHLAGAMGRPVWMLIPTICDWRWLRSLNDTTIWYDSMRIYRQKTLYDWQGVFNQVVEDLVAFSR